jgi:hypothetical protein
MSDDLIIVFDQYTRYAKFEVKRHFDMFQKGKSAPIHAHTLLWLLQTSSTRH